MNLRYKKILVFVLAGIVYLTGQYFRGVWFNPAWPLTCQEIHSGSIVYCNSPYLDTLGWPLIDLGQMLALIAVILLAANARTFRKWLKFTVFYIPIAVVLDYLIYPLSFAPGPIFQPASYSQGVYPFGWLYVIITFGIVLWHLLAARRSVES